LTDAPENRKHAEKLAQLIGAAIGAGKDPRALLAPDRPPQATARTGVTVREYFETWIVDKHPPLVRKAQARDYRRHIEGYVLPTLGEVALDRLTPRDIVGRQAELLARPLQEHARRRLPVNQRVDEQQTVGEPRTLSVKFVRNILLGSLRALLRDAARIDEVPIRSNLFDGLQWPRGIVPGPEPYEPEQRDRILAWFKTKRFGLHVGRPGASIRAQIHPPYYTFVHTLFWTGLRPSEAAGWHWGDADLVRGIVRFVRSRHLGQERATKTRAARRTVVLMPQTVDTLRAIQPLNVRPEVPVFTNLQGGPIEPKAFSTHWYACLRALGLPIRGLYATKDSFVSLAMSRDANLVWLQEQTGGSLATLRKHYGRWMRTEGADQLKKLEDFGPQLAPGRAGSEASF